MTHNSDYGCSLFVLVLVLPNKLDFEIQLKAHKLDRFVRKNLEFVCTNVIRDLLNKFEYIKRLARKYFCQLERVYVFRDF